ncbi:MAG: N-6 DNA methylase [Acidimicrobiales bacterium]
MDNETRRALGAWYTPAPIVEHVLDQTLEPVLASRRSADGLRVLDPACGDGAFLVAAGRRIRERFGIDPRPCLFGIDVDPVAATVAAQHATVVEGDGLVADLGAPFDVVVGNPPFLGQLRRRTARAEAKGDGYADTAALFLDRAITLARPDGGRIGLVLPQSLLAARDAHKIRCRALERSAFRSLWFAPEMMFDDASVHVVVATFERGGRAMPVTRTYGAAFTATGSIEPPLIGPWSTLVADLVGVPAVEVKTRRVLGDIAAATADFRDQYYGLIGAVSDDGDGPPLVTSGLIDVGHSAWGDRPARFAKSAYRAPRVTLDRLSPDLRQWATRRLVPKVLVATQTPVIEAVVDARGAWLPSVPVITVTGADPWSIAAVLSSPVASAWLAARTLGTGLSPAVLRPTARLLMSLPLPDRPWDVATLFLRDGDVLSAAHAMGDAYGTHDADAWWRARVR